MGIIVDLLKPADIESIFIRYRPITREIHSSDLNIMKCLLSNPRMQVEEIARGLYINKDCSKAIEKNAAEKYIRIFSIT